MKNIKEIKKHLGIGNRDIADAFGYSNETGYNNGKNGKVRLERGLEWFFSIVERGQKEKKKGSNSFD